MPDSTTKNYGWIKPQVHASPTTWGDKLNSDLDGIDATVSSIQNAVFNNGTLIGQIIMWPGANPPTNWWWCSGDAFSRTAYPDLFAILGTTYGPGDGSTTFNLPNFFNRFPVAYDGVNPMGSLGGEATHTLVEAELATHAHGVNDPGHLHGVGDPGHLHPIVQTQHTHGVSDPSHQHSFTNTVSGGSGIGLGSGISLQSGLTGAAATNISVQGAFANINNNATNAATTGITIGGAATGISIAADGGGQPHNNLPPYIFIGFIIRLL